MSKTQGIGYQKHCNEFTVTRCRTVFDTSSEERCWTVYKKKCEMVSWARNTYLNMTTMSPIKVYETVVDWEYEQKCTTSYEEECHGYGYHQECEKVSCSVLWQISLSSYVPRCPRSTASRSQRRWRSRCHGQSAGRFRTSDARTSQSTSRARSARNSPKPFALR